MTPDRPESIPQALQATPSIAAVLTALAGVDLNVMLALVGLAFLVLQIAYLSWRWRRDVLRERERILEHRPVPVTDSAELHP